MAHRLHHQTNANGLSIPFDPICDGLKDTLREFRAVIAHKCIVHLVRLLRLPVVSNALTVCLLKPAAHTCRRTTKRDIDKDQIGD